MVQHVILSLVVKSMDHYVMPTLDSYFTTTVFLICECPILDIIHLLLLLILSIHDNGALPCDGGTI
jgi:hypothetical protein